MIPVKTIDRLSALITIIGFVISVSKFMVETFKKYEKKHGKENKNVV